MSIESSLKMLDYIAKVSKEPIVLDGKPFDIPVPRSVTIHESFFWKDSCIMCGRCCMNETVVWTQEGVNRIMQYIEKDEQRTNDGVNGVVRIAPEDLEELSEMIQEKVVNINGQDRTFYVCPKDSRYGGQWHHFEGKGDRQRCHWMRELDGKFCCGIHPIRSVTCALPHIRFFNVKKTNRTVLRTMQYGRNQKLGCPIEFGPATEEGMEDKIYWLKVLKECADDLGISTWLPEIIEYLEEGNRKPVTFGEGLPRRGGSRGSAARSGIKQMEASTRGVNTSAKLKFSSLLSKKNGQEV